jgi:hypothetical protein
LQSQNIVNFAAFSPYVTCMAYVARDPILDLGPHFKTPPQNAQKRGFLLGQKGYRAKCQWSERRCTDLKVQTKAHRTHPCVPVSRQLAACSGWVDTASRSHFLTVSSPLLSVHTTAAFIAASASPGMTMRQAMAMQYAALQSCIAKHSSCFFEGCSTQHCSSALLNTLQAFFEDC